MSKCCSAFCFAELPPRPLLVVSCWARQMLGAADWNRRREPRATDHHPFIPRLDSSSYCPVLSFPFSLHLHIHLILFPLLRFNPLSLRLRSFFFLSYSSKGPLLDSDNLSIRCRYHSRRRWASANKNDLRKSPSIPSIITPPPALDSSLALARGKICASAAYLIIDAIH